MQNKFASMMTIALCSAAFTTAACKKKKDDAGAGSATAAAGSGSADQGSAGSAAAGSGSADTGSGSSAAAGSAAAPAGAGAGAAGCSATAYKSPAGAFCIDAPAGYKITETKDDQGVTVAFEDKTTMHSFAVTVADDEDNRKFGYAGDDFAARAKNADNKMLENADFGGGIGKIQVYTMKDRGKDTVQIWAVVKGKKHIYTCGGENLNLQKDVPLFPNACKTLRPMD